MGPLNGIKVIDLTSMVSGPVAAMMLGDQGRKSSKWSPWPASSSATLVSLITACRRLSTPATATKNLWHLI